jgi:hypothetical protein
MRRVLGVVVAGAAAGVTAVAGAAPTTIAPLHANTAVATYAGVQAWTDLDATTGEWHVIVRRNGRISTPSIPPAGSPIEVDVGRGASGQPMLAYTSCTTTCRVVVSGVDGSDPQTVPGSRDASHPVIWGDRVAWVSGAATVITSLTNGSGRRVLGGAPRTKCFHALSGHGLTCAAPQSPVVNSLALYGQRLALIDTFDLDDGVGANGTVTEVRTETTTGGPQQLVALISVGEGDESWVGPSWADGRLYFYMTSQGAGAAVEGFDPVRKTYVTAQASDYLTGFAVIDGGGRAYEATFPGDPGSGVKCGDEGTKPCAVVLSDPFAFHASKSLIHVP